VRAHGPRTSLTNSLDADIACFPSLILLIIGMSMKLGYGARQVFVCAKKGI
jgi:hypothetical protein